MGDRKTISIPENLHRDLTEQKESLDMTWPEFLKHLDRGEADIGEQTVEVSIDSEEVVERLLDEVREEGLFSVHVEAEDIASEVVGELDGAVDENALASEVARQVTTDVENVVERQLEEAVHAR